MARISLTSKDRYFVHQIDRWPTNGQYGDTYIYLSGHHIPIKKYDHEKKIIFGKNVEIHLNNVEQDHELFIEVVGKPWDNKYKALYKGDEDYTDYAPAFYSTLEDLHNDKLSVYNLH